MGLGDTIKAGVDAAEELLVPKFREAFGEIRGMGLDLNNTFGQVRQRISEISKTIGETIPEIKSLGGTSEEAYQVIKDVSETLKRNVITQADVAEKLFATTKVTGISTRSLVENFREVGTEVSRIGPALEKAVFSLQNIGMNTKDVLEDVNRNMSVLNKYHFEGGVEGLAKMAAQASMLNFSMRETFNIADKALSPEGAIELSSAFQRMGVSVGSLTDPFQLMYDSLMNPKGLNEALGNMTKQFTRFNQETKSFEISPAGMLQMRELASQTGIAYDELAKSALATSNLDRLLSQLKPSISFKNPEDKALLQNIAQMDTEGNYVVKLEGDEKGRKLEELTQEQINKLLEQQKLKGAMSMEDIAYQQLETMKAIAASLSGAKGRLEYGVVTSDVVTNISETMRSLATKSARDLNQALPDTKVFRGETQKAAEEVYKILSDFASGKSINVEEKLNEFEKYAKTIKESGNETLNNVLDKIGKNFNAEISKLGKTSTFNPSSTKTSATTKEPIKEINKIDFGGTIKFVIEAAPGVSTKELQTYVDSPEFKKKFGELFVGLDANQIAAFKKAVLNL
jgi:hypothetical protein